MSMEQNIKLLKFYYTPLLNTLLWEENMMLNYKLSIKPLKDLLNKKLFSLYFMKKDQVLSFKLSKKWIFWISLILYSKKVKIWFLKISTSLNSSIMMTNIYPLHLSIIINIEDHLLSLLVKKMLFGSLCLNLFSLVLLLGLS